MVADFDRVIEMECNPRPNEELGHGGFESSKVGPPQIHYSRGR